ncbi:amidase domain-containing protein [uncultured Amnibacterium sp.]|uniref:amidase domain-containing protein n=1 Tax=uncultured Amnibacterium sp. TaxID=1631851 RepID=UPI0035C9C1AD
MVGRIATVTLLAATIAATLAGCSMLPTAAAPGGGGAGGAPAESARPPATVIGSMAPSSGSVAGGTRVTVRGTGLAAVRSVTIGGIAVRPTTSSATSVTVVTPAQAGFDQGTVPVVLRGSGAAALSKATFHYALTSGVDKQLHYVLTYWKHYNPAWMPLDDNDCVDFTSQSLLARGWKPSADWTPNKANIYHAGPAWRGSNEFRRYVLSHHLGHELTDEERSKVKLGDVVQFDWNGNGDRDHTGVVTRITHTASGIRIFFAGHTIDSKYRNVDTAITKDHPGGKAWYLSLK